MDRIAPDGKRNGDGTMKSAQVTFSLPDTPSEQTFLTEYMVPAWSRFDDHSAFESGWFWRAGNFPHHELAELSREEHDLDRLEPGMIVFIINGDPQDVITAEEQEWATFRDRGVLEDWDIHWFHPDYANAREKLLDKYGTVGGARVYMMRTRVADLTIALLDVFDERLPAVGSPTDENPVPIGFWAMTHFMMKQWGYDWDEEIDACTKAITSRLHSLSSFTSSDVARRKLEAVIEELETVESTL